MKADTTTYRMTEKERNSLLLEIGPRAAADLTTENRGAPVSAAWIGIKLDYAGGNRIAWTSYREAQETEVLR